MVVTFLFLCAAALANVRDELAIASNADLGQATRQEAFDRLLAYSATDLRDILAVSQDRSGDTRQRWVAIRVLGKSGGPQARDALLNLLSDPEPAIRTAAVSALGDMGGYTSEIASRLQDPAIMVRAAAAEALARSGDRTAVPALSAALEDRSNYHRGTSLWVRKHYVLALGEIGDSSALPALLRALNDPDPEVAAAAIEASERVAGFSFAEGRSPTEEVEAWRRWMTAEIRMKGL